MRRHGPHTRWPFPSFRALPETCIKGTITRCSWNSFRTVMSCPIKLLFTKQPATPTRLLPVPLGSHSYKARSNLYHHHVSTHFQLQNKKFSHITHEPLPIRRNGPKKKSHQNSSASMTPYPKALLWKCKDVKKNNPKLYRAIQTQASGRKDNISDMFTRYCIIFIFSTDYGFLVHPITNSCWWRVDPLGNLIWINMVDLGVGQLTGRLDLEWVSGWSQSSVQLLYLYILGGGDNNWGSNKWIHVLVNVLLCRNLAVQLISSLGHLVKLQPEMFSAGLGIP